MLNTTKHEFTTLNIFVNNFLSWIFDVQIHLKAMNLGEIIKENNASLQGRTKAIIFMFHHLHE